MVEWTVHANLNSFSISILYKRFIYKYRASKPEEFENEFFAGLFENGISLMYCGKQILLLYMTKKTKKAF